MYGNSLSSGFTIEYFYQSAKGAREAFLASPFFSTYEPIRQLSENQCKIRLLVRLCEITTPHALRLSFKDANVEIRYYTDAGFHAKLYIIDDMVLVGSANLTDAGLKSNREASVVLRRDQDFAFEGLVSLFHVLWDHSDVLTLPVLEQYEAAWRSPARPNGEDAFDDFLMRFVDKCAPPTVLVGSEVVSKKRSFLQGFRRKYDALLIPAFREVQEVFEADGRRRRELMDGPIEIELSRFLGWLRIVHAKGETWHQAPLRSKEQRAENIGGYVREWHRTNDIKNGDMIDVDREIFNIARIQSNFVESPSLAELDYDETFETLLGCHAFDELMRFTYGGREGLRADFRARNPLKRIHNMIDHLAHGTGDGLERAYDCIFDERYRLERFKEACVMELAGWLIPNRPPINGRTIKALRFLGFQTEQE